ncbi:gamma-glutamyltransferase [Sediminibacterium sp. TEGAF015]|uniref:gamma-glutamyltransferase n=1 Tax=Sediminibacterium sp. TEGAF015 TaxID=575378 RepID=UPI00220011D9|nr:gamma-glutamyltransferase [Sediminibacterium sp. TEGAF015]BDQ10933.1 gamma-glutamyltransferase [Sediminibacterium sp. TEGAF015]
MRKYLSVFILLGSFVIANAQQIPSIVGPNKEVDPFNYTVVKRGNFKQAAVSSAHPLASMVGAAIMKKGGNAFDAAIATQLVLAVVFPNAGNLGGGGFLLARKTNGELIGIDYRESAPEKASRDMYLDKNGNAQLNLSQNGHLASGIPGTVAGLFATHSYAKLPFAELIQPAIDIAAKGFVLTEKEAASISSVKDAIARFSTQPTAFYKPTRWKVGDTLIQKDLAHTLERIQKEGAMGFYGGKTADLITAEMERGRGIITHADLKNYTAKLREPIVFNYRGNEIVSFAPPSSGGILLAQMMKMVEKYPMSKMGFQTPESVQLMIEAERRAFADRAEHMGDPDFWKVPVKTLISEQYLQQRMSDYAADKAGSSKEVNAGVIHESEETTHLSVVDAAGNMVAVTTTLNGSYGSKVVVGGAGFLLNNEMDDFSVKPGVPNMFGAVGGEANAIVPGKRMLSSMTPTMVLKNKKPYIVIGTPGGTTIPTSVYQALINVIDFNKTLGDAIDAPKFHHQWLPDEVMIETGFNSKTKDALQKMGYLLKDRSSIGRTDGIRILPNKIRETAADKRGDDSVAGY